MSTVYLILHNGMKYGDTILHHGMKYRDIILRHGMKYRDIILRHGMKYRDIILRHGMKYRDIILRHGTVLILNLPFKYYHQSGVKRVQLLRVALCNVIEARSLFPTVLIEFL